MARPNTVAVAKAPRKTLDIVAAPVATLPLGPSDQGEHKVLEFPKDHFKQHQGVVYAGDHLIIDLFGAKYLDDREKMELALIEAVEASGATLLHIHLHKFGDGGGVSGAAILSESHITVHTWPERGYAAFDAFMCGIADPSKALDVFKRVFEPTRTIVGPLKRGVLDQE